MKMSIYIVSNSAHVKDNLYKVGKSTQSSADIIKRYKTALGEPFLILHHFCSNHSQVEKDLHNLLSKYRCDGEWFRVEHFTLMKEIINYLESNAIIFAEDANLSTAKLFGRLKVPQFNKMGFTGKKEKMVEDLIDSDKSKLLLLNSDEKKGLFKCSTEDEANSSIRILMNNGKKITIDKDVINKLPSLTVAQLKELGAKGKKKAEMISYIESNTALINNITPDMQERMGCNSTKKVEENIESDLTLLTVAQLKELGAKGRKKDDLVNYINSNRVLLNNLTSEMRERMSPESIVSVKDTISQRITSKKLPFPVGKLTVKQLRELGAKGKVKADLVSYIEANKSLLHNLTENILKDICLYEDILEKNSTEEELDQWEKDLEGYDDLLDYIFKIPKKDKMEYIKAVFL